MRKITGQLDARLRVLIEPSEDILSEYENEVVGATELPVPIVLNIATQPEYAATRSLISVQYATNLAPITGLNFQVPFGETKKDQEIALLKAENERLRGAIRARLQDQPSSGEIFSSMQSWGHYTNQLYPLTQQSRQ